MKFGLSRNASVSFAMFDRPVQKPFAALALLNPPWTTYSRFQSQRRVLRLQAGDLERVHLTCVFYAGHILTKGSGETLQMSPLFPHPRPRDQVRVMINRREEVEQLVWERCRELEVKVIF